jgi:uncharacterized protein (TIGR03437 family)
VLIQSKRGREWNCMRVLSTSLFLLLAGTASAQQPAVADNGVLNNASYVKFGNPGHANSPGSRVSIFGSSLASSTAVASTVPVSTVLDHVSVTFSGVPAPLFFVSGTQINAQVPWEVNTSTGTATVVVNANGIPSAPKVVEVAPLSPGVFTFTGDGQGHTIAVNNADGFAVQPVGAVPGFPARPSKVGDVIFFYANGLGALDSPILDGHDSLDRLRRTVTTPTVLIGGKAVTPVFSGLAGQFPAVNQVNLVIPAGVTTGAAVPIQLVVGGITTLPVTTIAIN